MIQKVRKVNTKTHALISNQLFVSFLLVEAANILVSLTDIFVFRLPNTGLFTSWCASKQPNHFLKSLYLMVFLSNYSSRIQPVICCMIRAVMVYYPRDNTEYTKTLLKFSLPISILIPFALTSYMIPQLGFCTQLDHPFNFGAVGVTIDMNGPTNEVVHFSTSMICMTLNIGLTFFTMFVLRHILFARRTLRPITKLYKAELSLTLTMISSFIPFVIDAIFAYVSLSRQGLLGYILAIRPFALDSSTVTFPLVFYMTHPIFRKMKTTTISSISGRMIHNSEN